MEAALIGSLMVAICTFTALGNHPSSPLVRAIPRDDLRRTLVGLAMGSTSFALIHSPFGKRSGAHLNPAVTLTFFRLGKIRAIDAGLYVAAQFIGSAASVAMMALLLRGPMSHRAVRYAVTQGSHGTVVAFMAEAVISLVLMSVILFTTNSARLMRTTPLLVASLVAFYVVFEAPYSGTSMNPARSTASAMAARYFAGLWIYFLAPLVGMLSAAKIYLRLRKAPPICAKLHHNNNQPCIFRCGFRQTATMDAAAGD